MSVDSKVLKQVEFYFSNSNLPNDKFLRGLTEQNEGWVSIETIASFKKMRSLTEDMEVIVAALRKSEPLEVSEDGKQIKRKEALPEAVDTTPQSLYAKGFPKEYTLDDLVAFFTKQLQEGEKVLCTRMRRFPGNKDFKGSVFVEFDSVETATRLAALELKAPTPEEQPLVLLKKADYLAKKKAEYEERKASRKGQKRSRDGEEGKEGEKESSKKEEFKKEVTKDCIVKVSGLPEGCMREDIKGAFEQIGCNVVFVEFNRGNELGYVRMAPESEVKAAAAVAKMTEDKTTIKEVAPQLLVLEGEAEQAYWDKVFEMQQRKKEGGNRGRKFGGKKQRR